MGGFAHGLWANPPIRNRRALRCAAAHPIVEYIQLARATTAPSLSSPGERPRAAPVGWQRERGRRPVCYAGQTRLCCQHGAFWPSTRLFCRCGVLYESTRLSRRHSVLDESTRMCCSCGGWGESDSPNLPVGGGWMSRLIYLLVERSAARRCLSPAPRCPLAWHLSALV